MLRTLTALAFAAFTFGAHAAVDINKATQAELESIKGVGPSMSTKMMDERQKASFKDWSDLIGRVKGIGAGNAAKFSDAGLTVGGAAYQPGTVTADAKPAKPAIKAEAKKN